MLAHRRAGPPAGVVKAEAPQQLHPGLSVQRAILFRRAEALLGQPGRDLDGTVPGCCQRAQTLTAQRIRAQGLGAAHGACRDASRRSASDPRNRDVKPFAQTFSPHHDPLANLPYHLVSVCHRRGWGLPKCRTLLRQRLDGFALGMQERWGLRVHKTLGIRLPVARSRALVFPVLGQLPRHQALLGCDQPRVTRSPLTFVGRSLQALLPQPVSRLPLVLQARGGLQRPRQRGRFKGCEHPRRDAGIERFTGEILARVTPVVDHRPATAIALSRSWPPIADLQAMVARATDDDPGHQCRAMTHRAKRLGMGPVRG